MGLVFTIILAVVVRRPGPWSSLLVIFLTGSSKKISPERFNRQDKAWLELHRVVLEHGAGSQERQDT